MSNGEGSGSVEPILPVELGPRKVRFTQGVKAGRWVFATGVMAQAALGMTVPTDNTQERFVEYMRRMTARQAEFAKLSGHAPMSPQQ
jgi:thiamine monophosphate kinase